MGDVINFPKRDKYEDWTKVVPGDWDTFPRDGSDVRYRFHPNEEIDSEWDGQYEDGVFFSNGGFCDIYDVTHWIYR